MKTSLTPCPSCGRQISTAAVVCPQCGHAFPRITKRTLAILLVIGVVIWGLYEYMDDRSEREGIRLRDEAQRKLLGLPIPPRR